VRRVKDASLATRDLIERYTPRCAEGVDAI